MAITSTRTTTIVYSGDETATLTAGGAANAASPGQQQILTLASGANTITPPGGGATPVACTIVLPTSNTHIVTLKGVTGDTGVPLHQTDSTTIAIDPTCTSFVLTAAAQIVGVRLLWS